jgi:hypothetical protein
MAENVDVEGERSASRIVVRVDEATIVEGTVPDQRLEGRAAVLANFAASDVVVPSAVAVVSAQDHGKALAVPSAVIVVVVALRGVGEGYEQQCESKRGTRWERQRVGHGMPPLAIRRERQPYHGNRHEASRTRKKPGSSRQARVAHGANQVEDAPVLLRAPIHSFVEAIDVEPRTQAEDLYAIRCGAWTSVVEWTWRAMEVSRCQLANMSSHGICWAI